MDFFVKRPGPAHVVNFHQAWTQKFANFDIFFDLLTNYLVFHNEGYFVIWEEFIKERKESKIPTTINLAASL
jgi:hypothetical protein